MTGPHRTRSALPLTAWEPRFHITAERNWLNDPNGPIHRNGRYHLFFQENPAAPFWGPPHWGHVSSTDLVTWRRHPRALSPDPHGPDADGCWSGCVRDIDGVPTAYYTGVTGDGDARVESVCRATGSPDLTNWTKDPGNPLVPGAPTANGTGYHRDPYLWRDTKGWHMLLGSGTRGEEAHGTVLVYHSPDATRWTYGGVFFAPPAGLDAPGGLGQHWECPQLLEFDGTWALVLSIQKPGTDRPLSHVVYVVGDLDPDTYRFHPRATGLLDSGDAFYAPAVTTDLSGRTLLWGWAQEDLPPERQQHLHKAGALTLPRQLTLSDDRIESRPPRELSGLREPNVTELADRTSVPDPNPARTVPAHAEISATGLGTRGPARLHLTHTDSVTSLTLSVDPDRRSFQLRTRQDSGTRQYEALLPHRADGDLVLYLDGSLIEAYYGGTAITTRCYPQTTGPWRTSHSDLDADVSRGLFIRPLQDAVITSPDEREGEAADVT
ncbi:glycoside hydrolase family 32 protein [Streptomyces sp. NBC_01716]|uniref:glycoside hydrolase family 32 protein n=1 Tax=Streptomyces sp. NBC_01716 TaxID=2975917 RepID=UPI002E311CD2|nr:glycoside hydrolase family 32 protein [Streptomyces sp. NBC_01716]